MKTIGRKVGKRRFYNKFLSERLEPYPKDWVLARVTFYGKPIYLPWSNRFLQFRPR